MEVKCLFGIDTQAVKYVAEFTGCPEENVFGNFDDFPRDDMPVILTDYLRAPHAPPILL